MNKQRDLLHVILNNVIINEKRPKSLKKYLVDKVPHIYESKEQFNFMVKLPKGVESAGFKNFKNTTKPSIVKNIGSEIAPITKQRLTDRRFL